MVNDTLNYQPPNKQMGLPAEYSAQLFNNLQGINKGQMAASRQSILDSSRNPAMAGVQQLMLRQNQQAGADRMMEQGTNAQLQGVQEGLTDRRQQQTRDFTASESAAERANRIGLMNLQNQGAMNLQMQGQQNESATFGKQLLAGGAMAGMGMIGGPVFGAIGGQLANQIAAPPKTLKK